MALERIAIGTEGTEFTGWEDFSVTTALNQATRSFNLKISEVPLNGVVPWNLPPGTPVTITATGDALLTGYVFVYEPSAGPTDHSIDISGRGLGANFIDSSVSHKTGIFEDKTFPEIAKELLQPFGQSVRVEGSEGPKIPYFQMRRGSSVYAELLRAGQDQGWSMTEDADGTLVLRARDAPMPSHGSSGLVQGVNIISMSARLSYEDQFDQIGVAGQDSLGTDDENNIRPYGRIKSNLFGAFRFKEIIAPTATDPSRAKSRAMVEWFKSHQWETQAHITVPGFRDANGRVWHPGYGVYVKAPFLHIEGEMLIYKCEYVQNRQRGTTTRITLVDPADQAGRKNEGDIGDQRWSWMMGGQDEYFSDATP